MTEFDEPNPGSSEAVDKGCTCHVLANHHGAGYSYDNARCFDIDDDCPLHGDDDDIAKAMHEEMFEYLKDHSLCIMPLVADDEMLNTAEYTSIVEVEHGIDPSIKNMDVIYAAMVKDYQARKSK